MITCDIWGGLGNQLFMAAAVIAHGERIGVDYAFPEHTIDNRVWKNQLPAGCKRMKFGGHLPVWNEPAHHYTQIPDNIRNDRFHGFFQSYKYFEDHEDKVRTAFGFNQTSGINAVSIHIRRGDYLLYPNKHPVVTVDYLRAAIEAFPADEEFLVFSDDLGWCHKNLKGERFKFAEAGNRPMLDLKVMSLCKHNIISNSTFSWWAAYMNINPDKIVITPHEDNWFGPGNKHLDVKDLIPESWVRIKY